MLSKMCSFAVLTLCSGLLFAQVPVQDGSGGGEAHDCIVRTVHPAMMNGSPLVALRNTCSKPVRVYYCGTVDGLREQWRCSEATLDSEATTSRSDMDTRKFNCVLPRRGDFPFDPTCSRWTLAWNAVYKDSNQTPTRPDGVPKPLSGGSAR
jgi:hypothetical protein